MTSRSRQPEPAWSVQRLVVSTSKRPTRRPEQPWRSRSCGIFRDRCHCLNRVNVIGPEPIDARSAHAPTIWVDADACPVAVREVICRAAIRTETRTVLVANRAVRRPPSRWIENLQVPATLDAADNEIVRRLSAGDLVITADVPLAAEVIAARASAIHPRGETFSPDTIRQKLMLRDFMDTMRASGERTGGPSAMAPRDVQRFANALDRWLAQARRS